tara:strand:+ start:142 stop:324 length:183 start_codon:yes stop_codon:yes gene_type:complete
MLLTWGSALLLSILFRLWGYQHPDPFTIRPLVVVALLFGPSLLLGLWIISFGFRKESLNS